TVLLSFAVAFPVRLSARCIDGVLVLVLEQIVFWIEINGHSISASHKRDVLLVEELVLASESLHAVRHMPRNRVAILPMLLESVPDGAEVLRVLEDDDREILLLHLRNVRHP